MLLHGSCNPEFLSERGVSVLQGASRRKPTDPGKLKPATIWRAITMQVRPARAGSRKLLPLLATIGQIGAMKNAGCALCGRAAPGSPDTISSHEPSTNEHAGAESSAGPNAIPSFSSVDRATSKSTSYSRNSNSPASTRPSRLWPRTRRSRILWSG